MVLAYYHQARKLSVCSGAGLEGEVLHAGYGGKRTVYTFIYGIYSGYILLQRMYAAECGHCGNLLVDLRVVLHGAATQRIESGVHAKVHLTQVGVVTNYIHLTYLGEFRSFATEQSGGYCLCALELAAGLG